MKLQELEENCKNSQSLSRFNAATSTRRIISAFLSLKLLSIDKQHWKGGKGGRSYVLTIRCNNYVTDCSANRIFSKVGPSLSTVLDRRIVFIIFGSDFRRRSP